MCWQLTVSQVSERTQKLSSIWNSPLFVVNSFFCFIIGIASLLFDLCSSFKCFRSKLNPICLSLNTTHNTSISFCLLQERRSSSLLWFRQYSMSFLLPHSARRKDLSNPEGSKDGPKSGIIFVRQPASHPADRLSYNHPNLSNQWSHLTTIVNFRLSDQTKAYICFKWRLPQVEEDLLIFKCE